MSADPVRVLVASSDSVARAGLVAWLREDERLVVEVAAEGVGPADAPPEAVVWDVGLDPHVSDLHLPLEGVPTVALVSTPAQARPALAAGAQSVVMRDAPPTRLAEAVRATAQGLVVLDETLASEVMRPLARDDRAALPEPLTAREREVLALLAEGLSNRLIAGRLGISEHTAKFHVNAILGKLGAESRAEALVVALRLGLVTL